METSPNIPCIPVSEAITLMHKHKSVEHAFLEILDICNISRAILFY